MKKYTEEEKKKIEESGIDTGKLTALSVLSIIITCWPAGVIGLWCVSEIKTAILFNNMERATHYENLCKGWLFGGLMFFIVVILLFCGSLV